MRIPANQASVNHPIIFPQHPPTVQRGVSHGQAIEDIWQIFIGHFFKYPF
jgi:hypothetical protein